MEKYEIEGFLSNPFFVALNPKNKDSEDIKSMLEYSYERGNEKNNDLYVSLLNEILSPRNNFVLRFNGLNDDFKTHYIEIIKQVVLDSLVLYDALKYFYHDEDYFDIVKIIKRNQITSKKVQMILNRISWFTIDPNFDFNILLLKLDNDIRRKINDYNDSFVIKSMGKFKEVIDKITSGVDSRCYIDFNQSKYVYYLSEELTTEIYKKHGYDIRQYEFKHQFIKILTLSLYNDEAFWNFENPSKYNNGIQYLYTDNRKTLISFVYFVEKYNGVKCALKLIDYAFSEACKNPIIKKLYDNKLPFYLLSFESDLIESTSNRLTKYLSKVIEVSFTDEEKKGLIYPIYQGYEEYILKGQKVFNNFIKKAYPNDYDRVINMFDNLDTIIQDAKRIDERTSKITTTIRDMLDYDMYSIDSKTKKAYLDLFYPNYQLDESLKARLYYKLYLIDKYSNELSQSIIYEFMYGILKMINEKYNTKCSYVLDTTLRDECYLKLKNILAKYNLNIDDNYKDLYIIALLDRKYATYEETSHFAELEQYGDAIYQLAVDNIIFYNPESEIELNHIEEEKYVNANAQVLISQKIGLDKCYISKLFESANSKYDDNESYSLIHNRLSGHYLADSLEMVIGVVAKEFGVQRALDFVTDLICEANSNLSKPQTIKFTDFADIYNTYNYDVLRDYLNKIFPRPFDEDYDYGYHSAYSTIGYAVSKIVKIAIIGNDNVKKRNMIASDGSSTKTNNGYSSYELVISYLYYGIEETIKKYKAIVESNYSDYLN